MKLSKEEMFARHRYELSESHLQYINGLARESRINMQKHLHPYCIYCGRRQFMRLLDFECANCGNHNSPPVDRFKYLSA